MTLVIAHRGASVTRPENTIPAFLEARRQGADMVELDVRRTADGELAVHHDPEVPGSGALVTLRSEQLNAEIPTFAAAVDACLPLGVNVEIKNAPNEPDWDETDTVAKRVAEFVAARRLYDEILVSSFNWGSVHRVRDLDPAVRTALLTAATNFDEAIERCLRDGHEAFHPFVLTVSPEVVRDAHDAGLRVNVWTVDDADLIRRLADWGVDGIVTNVPDVALRALGR